MHAAGVPAAHGEGQPRPRCPVGAWPNGVWLDHPLHRALTDVPIGAWTMTLSLDALAAMSGSPGMRRDGEIYAVEEWCTHLGGPLADGKLDGTAVTRPWHGSCFDLATVEPLNGPATVPLRRLETRVHGGRIELRACGE